MHVDRARLAALAACFVVGAVFTFPLILKLTTHVPSSPADEDVFAFIWNNWWISYSILERHQSPLTTSYLFSPFDVDLRLHALGLLYGVVSIPITVLAGPVAALNLQALATPALNGYFTFGLSRYLTRDDRASVVAGLAIAATPAINFHLAMGRVSCAAVWPAIASLSCFLRLLDRPRLPQALTFSASLSALLLIDQQIALFGVLWLSVLLVCLCLTPVGRQQVFNRRLVAAALLAGALAAPVGYWLYLKPLTELTGYTVPAASEAATYSYPLSLLWTPSMAWRVYGSVLIAGLLSGLLLAARAPAIIPWLVGASLFISLSFGPGVEGASLVRPFAVLRALIPAAQFRTPYRFQIPAAIGAAMCVSFVLAWLRPRLNQRAMTWTVAALAALVLIDILFYRMPNGFPVQTQASHHVYTMIAGDPNPGIVLEVPFGVRCGTDRIGTGERLNFYQPQHRKRMINGMIARVPLAALAYYRGSPALMYLASDAPVPAGDLGADFRARLRELDVRHVVIHLAMLNDERRRGVLDLVAGVRELEKQYEDDEVVLFQVAATPRAR